MCPPTKVAGAARLHRTAAPWSTVLALLPHAKRTNYQDRRNFRETQSAMLATLTAGTTTKR